MFSNRSTVWLWAGYGVSHNIFQLRVKREDAVWSSQLPANSSPSPAQISATHWHENKHYFGEKWLQS